MSNCYIYASSDTHSTAIHLPHELEGCNWQIGLCEISYGKTKTTFPVTDVCCDIITPNFKNGLSSQILRRVAACKNAVDMRFNPVYYHNVMSTNVRDLNIYLKSDKHKIESFTGISLNCTLHLRKHE